MLALLTELWQDRLRALDPLLDTALEVLPLRRRRLVLRWQRVATGEISGHPVQLVLREDAEGPVAQLAVRGARGWLVSQGPARQNPELWQRWCAELVARAVAEQGAGAGGAAG